MSQNNNEDRVLGGQIAEHLKNRAAERNDRTPLPLPAAMTDPRSTPEQRASAEEGYAANLLNRRELTADEQKWLQNRIAACVKEMRSTGELSNFR